MAISDDGGQTWYASKPLIGFGNIQPAVLRAGRRHARRLHARERAARSRIRVSESKDDGLTWGTGRRHRDAQPRQRASTASGWPTATGCSIYNDSTRAAQQPGRLALRRRGQDLEVDPAPGEASRKAPITTRRSSRAGTGPIHASTAISSRQEGGGELKHEARRVQRGLDPFRRWLTLARGAPSHSARYLHRGASSDP